MKTLPKSASFAKRAFQAVKAKSFSQAVKLANDVAKHHFARYLVVDANGTKQFAWTLSGAYAWIPFCAQELVRIVDTSDFSVVAERKQAYAY